MLRRDGLVKVLDFGLAKLSESAESNVDSEGETRAAGENRSRRDHGHCTVYVSGTNAG